jgi:hypothetical protein
MIAQAIVIGLNQWYCTHHDTRMSKTGQSDGIQLSEASPEAGAGGSS